MDKRPATIFCDIDGTLVIQSNPTDAQLPSHKLSLLEGTIEKLLEWDKLGYKIILTTGRKESTREATIKQLQRAGILYDQLIMGFGPAVRYLINDIKPNGTPTAYSINLDRNEGIGDLGL